MAQLQFVGRLVQRTVLGLLTVFLYFADIISDAQVAWLLFETTNYIWAAQAAFLIALQFFLVWQRVVTYMHATHGSESPLTRLSIWLGPLGPIALDFLMFLEPFQLLPRVPLPGWLRDFIPAYKATRIIVESLCESLPQLVLQVRLRRL